LCLLAVAHTYLVVFGTGSSAQLMRQTSPNHSFKADAFGAA
jgi:hypothetical protein